MVLWVIPVCHKRARLLSRHTELVALFLLIFCTSRNDFIAESTSASSQAKYYYSSAQNVVNTKYGPLKGVRLQFSTSGKRLDPVTGYLGIPYASPPVNAYRFMPPVAPLPWRETRMATTPPPACPQRFPDISNKTKALQAMTAQRYLFLQKLIPYLANQSEDCLYLNFYVPTVPPGDDIRPGRFPIVLIIHGESWEWGSGNEFDGAAFSSLGNHIVVTFNYRLGPLGFLKTSNQQSNFGLLDVIAALHWVKENADSFGGDKNRITLIGYRTGAVVANLLLVAQIAKGLFQRAILISGSVLSPWALQRRPEDIAKQLSAHLGCVGKLPLSHPESDLAPCLRKKHVSDLLNFVPDSPKFLSPYAPYVDNILLKNPKSTMEGQPSDQFVRAEILMIFTTSEGVHELNDYELKNGFESEHRDRILRTLVRNVFNYHQQEIFSIVRNEYTDWERPILHPIPLRDATVEALSDCLVIGPALQVALIHAKRGAKTYVMHFSHVSKDNEFPSYERLGSLEGDVVPYAMGLPVINSIPTSGGPHDSSPWSFLTNFSKQDAFVSETLVHYITNFARSGDPNLNEPSMLPLSGTDPHLGLSSSAALRRSSSGISGGMANEWNVQGGSGGAPIAREQRLRLRPLHWDFFEPVTQSYMNVGAKPRMRTHYRGHKMALWLNLIPQIHLPGGSDVTISHHAFPDDNPNLYIGAVRPLSALNVGENVPGFGIIVKDGTGGGPQTVSPGSSLTTTECVESTESPLSQGTRHSVMRIDSNEVEVEIRGHAGANSEPVVPLSSSPNSGIGMSLGGSGGDYDYTTALTVTITVGVVLILLNLVVFSAIMCHRKRGLPIPNNAAGVGGGSDTESRRSSHSGTPQKTYQEECKWSTSCCSSAVNPNDFPTAHLSYDGVGESISMNQYEMAIPPPNTDHIFHQNCTSDAAGVLMGSPPSLMGLPSPGTLQRNPRSHGYSLVQHQHQQQQLLHQQDSDAGSCSGTLKRTHQIQLPMSIPDCVQPVPNAVFSSDFDHGPTSHYDMATDGSTPIRLYMNQAAASTEPPRAARASASCGTGSGQQGIIGGGGGSSSVAAVPPPPPPSSTATNTTNSTSSNPSPNSGSTTLVGVLKRHSNTTPNSTVKKRVQIQEISV